MRQFFTRMRQLPRSDVWLLTVVVVILIAIMAIIGYGIRQSEMADEREREYRAQIEAKAEQNRLEIERNAAEAQRAIEALKREAAEVRALQSQSELRDVRGELASLDQARRLEQQQYDKKLKSIIVSNLSACERWLKNCADAKRLGLRDPDAPCTCR